MASPPRNRKGQFPPIAAEALGLSIHPSSNEVQSSPPLAAVPNSMVATAASSSQPPSKRGSQIRQSSGGSGPLGPSALSQEMATASPEFHPPSPSHTASPPQISSNFSPTSQPMLHQSPSQMPVTGGTYNWSQNRVPPPTMNTAAAGPRLINDNWATPDSDVLIPPLQPKKQQLQSPPGPALEEREEDLHHTPPRANGDWGSRGGGGTLADAMAQRTSPTAQLLQGNGNGVRAGGVNANRPRVRGAAQSSSPVMMQAVRQAALQNSPPQLPSQPTMQTRGTPPSLQGLIAPNVNPPPPILPRANTENPAASAVAAGVRPLGGTPPNVNNYPRNNTTSPPGFRNPSTNSSITSSPPYRTPMESLQGGTSYLSESSSYSTLPFEYDHDEDNVYQKSPQQQYSNQPQSDPRNRTSIDSYRRDQQDSPPPIHIRSVPNQQPASISQPPPQPQQPPIQPQVQTQAVPRPSLYPTQPASAVSGSGSHIRPPMARSFPVVHEEVDDEVVAVPQQPPVPRSQPSSQPPPANRWASQSRERERSPERVPSPPPAPPVQHPPIPLFSPQSVQAGQPAVLRDPRKESSTPSPPPPLRINPDAGSRRAAEEEVEAAEPSSDSFTPKSPTVALPGDHGYTYTNNNYGRMGSHNRMQGAPYTPVDPYGSYGGSLHHALFAMQMGGMPPPRGPMATFNNYGARESFTSLSGAAAALSGKPESPYPAPPMTNNANGSSGKHGPQGFSGASADGGTNYNYDSSGWMQPGETTDGYNYLDFIEWQRKMHANRPDAPIPPTPQSYASPQQSNIQQSFTGDQRNGSSASREGDDKGAQQQQQSNGHGYGNVPAYGNGYGPGAMLDPNMIPDRYIPSALSSYLSSPMMHNPFLPRFPPPQSLVSSPSHIPLDLGPAPLGGRRLHKKKSKRQLRGSGSGTSKGGAASSSVPKTSSKLKESIQKPPTPPPADEFPRVASTVPKDTSSEESDTDGTKKNEPTRKPVPIGPVPQSETEEEEDEDDDVWLDESSEDELDVEYHSRYIQNPSKRKRKWEQKWDSMVRLFQEIDRTTDSPMVLLAAPSTSPSPKTHILISRSIQRNPGKYMPHAQTARQSFAEIAKLRRKEKADAAAAERARRAAGFEQQLAQIPFLGPRWDAGSADSGGRGSSSPGSAGFSGPALGGLEKLQELPSLAAGGEDGLKQALSVALDSLKQMHMIYEQREERRREELERQRQEASNLENLFRMMAIESAANSSQGSGPAGAGSPASSSGVPSLSGKKSP